MPGQNNQSIVQNSPIPSYHQIYEMLNMIPWEPDNTEEALAVRSQWIQSISEQNQPLGTIQSGSNNVEELNGSLLSLSENNDEYLFDFVLNSSGVSSPLNFPPDFLQPGGSFSSHHDANTTLQHQVEMMQQMLSYQQAIITQQAERIQWLQLQLQIQNIPQQIQLPETSSENITNPDDSGETKITHGSKPKAHGKRSIEVRAAEAGARLARLRIGHSKPEESSEEITQRLQKRSFDQKYIRLYIKAYKTVYMRHKTEDASLKRKRQPEDIPGAKKQRNDWNNSSEASFISGPSTFFANSKRTANFSASENEVSCSDDSTNFSSVSKS